MADYSTVPRNRPHPPEAAPYLVSPLYLFATKSNTSTHATQGRFITTGGDTREALDKCLNMLLAAQQRGV